MLQPLKKVLFITYDGLTDPLGQSQIIPYLAGLSDIGHTITIISAEKKERFRKNHETIERLLREHRIAWVPVFYTKKPPIISTLWDICKINRKAMKLQSKEKFDIVHCRSFLGAIIGFKMKRRFNVKFIFDMRGFWADERVEAGLWPLHNPLYKAVYSYCKRREFEFLDEADEIISLTENARHEILTWQNLKNQPVPIEVIACCADLDFFNRDAINISKLDIFRNELQINGENFILTYIGSIGTWYLTYDMLRFFKRLLQKKTSAKFLFITPDSPGLIYKQSDALNIARENIIIRAASRRDIPTLLSLSTLAIFFIKNTYSKKASSPVKQGELMSLGIPLICNAGIGDVEYIVKKTGSGIALKSLSDEDFDEVIEHLDSLISIPAERIVRGAKSFYSLNEGVEKYDHIYRHL